MDLGLSEKVAVVTGASKGIGLAVTRLLAAEGAAVVAGARTVDALDGVEAFAVDLGRPGGPEALIAHAMARYGRLDVLVNSVGRVQLRLDGFLATSDADFEASLQINFFAALRATRAAVAPMLEQGGGTIVNVASVNAFFFSRTASSSTTARAGWARTASPRRLARPPASLQPLCARAPPPRSPRAASAHPKRWQHPSHCSPRH
jgi:NAD(P)-dependent dehydrogenase (short-subunit alcohol dehydrogenase family)